MSRNSLELFGLMLVLLPAASAQTTSPPAPTAAQQQVIAKCTDATHKAQDAIGVSIQLRTTASSASTQIKSLTSDLSGNAAKTLTAFADAIRKLADSGLPSSLDTTTAALNKQKQSLTDVCKADGNQLPQELLDAQAAATSASTDIDTELTEITKTTNSLNAAIDSVPSAAGQMFDWFGEKIKGLKALNAPADKQPLPDADQKTLAQGLAPLSDVLEQLADAKPAWRRLSTLDVFTSTDARKNAIKAAQAKLDGVAAKDGANGVDTDLTAVCGNLSKWFAALDISTADPKQKAADAVTQVLLDPGANSSLAGTEQKDASQALTRVNAVLTVWPRLSLALALKGQPTVDTDDLANKIATLSADARTLQTLVARIADALAGDMSQFVTEQVRLYYFTDVDRLMRALNPASYQVGGLAEAQAQAAAQRKALADAEFDLADAQAEVNRIQKSVLDLREQQRQQAAAADSANLIALKLQNALKKAQRRQQSQEDALAAAQADLQTSPNDPALKAAVDKAQAKKDTATTATTRANDAYTQAQSDATSANDKLEASKADQNGIPAKLAQAQQALEAAQASVSAARRKMLGAAQAESEAFANARDHAPFWVSDAVAADTDPVKHVIIFGFPDNATLLLRGKPEDVLMAKEVIATFDKPAPQARLTLWSFEINSDMGQFYRGSGAKNLNESMEIVDEELGNTRSLVNATVDLLLTEINEQVRSGPGCVTTSSSQDMKALEKLKTREIPKWRRVRFFSQDALTAFGFDFNNPDPEILMHLLPDPAATTTLGEGLLMLALSCENQRHVVQENFVNHLPDRLASLNLRTRRDGNLRTLSLSDDLELPEDWNNAFSRTWQALGPPAPSADGFSSHQFEITFALKDVYERRVRDYLISAVRHSSAEFAEATRQRDTNSAAADDLKEKGRSLWQQHNASAPLPTALAALGNAERQYLSPPERRSLDQAEALKSAAVAKMKSIAARDEPLLNVLYAKYKLSPSELDPANVDAFTRQLLTDVPSEPELARFAAADEMIKKMIIAVEDDLNTLFIQPMLYRLRMRILQQHGIRVGVVQRESILATNRLVARVDPRASAHIQVGEEQDILGSVQQLAQLYLAAQSGGALAVLGGLQKQPREKPPEIYGIGTGNTFQVTPIFDPSGQALRFKFDYVQSTRVTEPSGGVDPQLPRIERHTVNTEVQLSNLETREISRFEANSKIGIPSHYWGGIPILKDIPYVRPYVPLLGWFVRRAGQNAAAQQSVIFGQTTIYPSISDLGALLAPIDWTEFSSEFRAEKRVTQANDGEKK